MHLAQSVIVTGRLAKVNAQGFIFAWIVLQAPYPMAIDNLRIQWLLIILAFPHWFHRQRRDRNPVTAEMTANRSPISYECIDSALCIRPAQIA